jgi:hypothetical protein
MRTMLRHAAFALTAALVSAAGAVAVSGASGASGASGTAAASRAACHAACTEFGAPVRLGDGTARTYVRSKNGVPREIGVVIDFAATDSMPFWPPSDGGRCYDVDGDGRVDQLTECAGGYYLPLLMPPNVPAPYRWVLLNWNPFGHPPPGVYDVPHFDMHFYVVPRSAVAPIRLGKCDLLVACDQIPEIAKPLPARYVPSGYPASMPDTIEVGMGDHLDTGAGFVNGATFIYGAIGGSLAFLEPMVKLDALRHAPPGGPRQCTPVAQPPAWERDGWYPTRYCLGQTTSGGFQVSLDGLVEHQHG